MKIALLFTAVALLILNPFDAFGVELTSLSPGTNEVHFEHDGHSRRLIVTTPTTYSRQLVYPVLFCFQGAGGRADGQSERWSPQADLNGFVVICAEAIRPLTKWNFKDNFHAQEYDDVGFIVKVVEVLIENKIVVDTCTCPSGLEVVLCKVKNQEHHIRRDLRDRADSIAIEFLLKHKRK